MSKNLYGALQLLVITGLLFTGSSISAQCPNDNSFYTDITPTGVGNTQTNACIFAGEYVTVNVCSGASYTFSTCGSSFDTQITLYNQGSGTVEGYNDDFCGLQSEVTYVATFTGVLRILVDFYPCGALPTCFTISATMNTACGGGSTPPNDDPCGATLLPTNNTCSFSTQTNAGATPTVGPLPPGCANYLGGDVWFKAVVPASGAMTIDSDIGTVTDGGMAVYSAASCSGPFLVPLDCDDDDSPNGLMSLIALSGLTPGDTIWIRFWEYGNDNNGSFDICVFDPAGGGGGNPCGVSVPDSCSIACSLGSLPAPNLCDGSPSEGQGITLQYNLTNIGATAQNPYQYITNCQGGGNMAAPSADVWYSFVAGGPNLDVLINNTTITPSIGLWESTGNCATLIPRGCAVGSAGNLNASFTLLQVGVTYYLQVSGAALLDIGTFDMNLTNWEDCSICLTGANLTTNPPPINGTYPPATPVTFTFNVTNWNFTLANWLHGVVPTFGPGWDTGTLTSSPSASCDGAGTWFWMNMNISSATGDTSGPGFFYDTFWGGPLDGITGNNYGDNCGGPWSFSWTINTSSTGCVTGDDLSVVVNTLGDGESGSWTSVACTNDPEINFSSSMTCLLPVDYMAWEGSRVPNGNMLKWATASEINSDYFELERSLDGLHFQAINKITAAGNSSSPKDYTYLDPWFETGDVQYRLRQVDKNGLSNLSEILTISYDITDIVINNIYPNPVDRDLFASLFVPEEGRYEVEVMDMTGRLHMKETHYLKEGAGIIQLDVADLRGSVYFLRIKNYAANIEVKQKFVK